MDKRFQVFVSSTFTDLKDERQAVLRAILELDHMPAGMELFPAADDSAWQLIRDVIDASDYYVLIIGGRYGSLDEAGIGYTEKEYEYACSTRKPVIALLHENPDNLPRQKTETDGAGWEKLKAFRKKVEKGHTCVYWNNADELKVKVILGISAAIKRQPAIGWVRADTVPTGATLAEVLKLRNRIGELEAETAKLQEGPPAGTELLSSGEDELEAHCDFTVRDPTDSYPYDKDRKYSATINVTWNGIFAAVAPRMINECGNSALTDGIKEYFTREGRKLFQPQKGLKGKTLREFIWRNPEVETCIVQLRALGLIRESDRKRSLKDTGTYWTLTPYGNLLMVQLRAVRKIPLEDASTAEDAELDAGEE